MECTAVGVGWQTCCCSRAHPARAPRPVRRALPASQLQQRNQRRHCHWKQLAWWCGRSVPGHVGGKRVLSALGLWLLAGSCVPECAQVCECQGLQCYWAELVPNGRAEAVCDTTCDACAHMHSQEVPAPALLPISTPASAWCLRLPLVAVVSTVRHCQRLQAPLSRCAAHTMKLSRIPSVTGKGLVSHTACLQMECKPSLCTARLPLCGCSGLEHYLAVLRQPTNHRRRALSAWRTFTATARQSRTGALSAAAASAPCPTWSKTFLQVRVVNCAVR